MPPTHAQEILRTLLGRCPILHCTSDPGIPRAANARMLKGMTLSIALQARLLQVTGHRRVPQKRFDPKPLSAFTAFRRFLEVHVVT